MNKLDAHIRRALLCYPLIFTTRWDVLRHLFLVIGNGYEWTSGELVDIGALHGIKSKYDRDEDEARAHFFEDLEEAAIEEAEFTAKMRKRFPDYEPDAAAVRRRNLRYYRRQFQLDHLDELVHETRHDAGVSIRVVDTMMFSDSSKCMTVPDNVEDSYLDGAISVLGEVAQAFSMRPDIAKDKKREVEDELRRLRRMQEDRRDA